MVDKITQPIANQIVQKIVSCVSDRFTTLAWYPFEEGPGNLSTVDVEGNYPDLTAFSTPIWADVPPRGSCLEVGVPNDRWEDTTEAVADAGLDNFAVGIHVREVANNTGDFNRIIIDKDVTGIRIVYNVAQNRLRFLARSSGGNALFDYPWASVPAFGSWWHIGLQIDRSDADPDNHIMRCYVDGVEVGNVPLTGVTSLDGGDFLLGSGAGSGSGSNMYLDGLKFWDRVLSDSEWLAEANN